MGFNEILNKSCDVFDRLQPDERAIYRNYIHNATLYLHM